MIDPLAVRHCPACHASHHTPYLQTAAHLHEGHPEPKFSFRRCAACTTVFLSPRLPPQALAAYYPPTYLPYRGEHAWGRFGAFVRRDQQRLDRNRLHTVRRFAPARGPVALLDVGCGRPTFLALLRQQTDWHLTGLDFVATGWQAESWPGLTLHVGEVNGLCPEPTYDLVTMWHYLEHDYDPLATLRTLRDCLRSGGRLIIEVPDGQSLTARWQGAHWEGWHAPRHTVLYSGEGFRRLLDRAGYRILTRYRYGTLDAFTLWWMGQMEKRRTNWAGPMTPHFAGLVGQKLLTYPLFGLQKLLPLGLQTVVAEAK